MFGPFKDAPLYRTIFRRIVLTGIILGTVYGIWRAMPTLGNVLGDNAFDYVLMRAMYVFFWAAFGALLGSIVGIMSGLVGVVICFVFRSLRHGN